MNNPREYFLNSGGAVGSDFLWGELGKEYGIPEENIKHWRPEDYTKLSPADKWGVDAWVEKTCEILGRPFKPQSKYYPLIARDWFQVDYSDAVYAVGRIIIPDGKDPSGYTNTSGNDIVSGGTGYAVSMGIQLGLPVYVFDMNTNDWYRWWDSRNCFLPEYRNVPTLTKRFAGIGSRQITDEGIQAIRNVYEKTFK